MSRRKSHDPAWLKERGYDGLYADFGGTEACGCDVDDFAPCGEGPLAECVPARRGEESQGELPVLFYRAVKRVKA
jgi:hypothetical protein